MLSYLLWTQMFMQYKSNLFQWFADIVRNIKHMHDMYLKYIDQQLKSTKVVWWTSKKSFCERSQAGHHHDNIWKQRNFSMSTRRLLWTLAADLCILKTYHAYVLCCLQYQQFIGINLTRTACIFSVLIKNKAIFVDFIKMKRGKLSENSIILAVFCEVFDFRAT